MGLPLTPLAYKRKGGAALMFSFSQAWLTHTPSIRISSRLLPRKGAMTPLLCAVAGEEQDKLFYFHDEGQLSHMQQVARGKGREGHFFLIHATT